MIDSNGVIMMATRQNVRREGRDYNRTAGQMYVYGNVVTKPSYEPERRVREPERKKRVSRQVKQNRRNALRMNPGYVMFLAVAAVLALVVCVNYVKLQSRITSHSENIAAMQEELADLKEENNTRYNSVIDSVNLEEVRTRAQENLGMVYASSEQVIEYNKPSADYVKQYEGIPKDGVLAQSDKNTD